MRGAEERSLNQPAFHPQPAHAFHPQRQHRIETVFESQVKNPGRRHTQGQCPEGVDKEPGNQRGQPLGVVKLHSQHRAAPLQAQRPGHQLLAHSLVAHQPLAQPAAAGRPLRLEGPAQLDPVDPSLLEHGQAQRNPVAVILLGHGARIQFPPERRLNPHLHATGGAAPPTLKDRRRAAAPQL